MADGRHPRVRSGTATEEDADDLPERYEMFERQRRRYIRLGRLLRQREGEAEDLRNRSRGRISVEVARERVRYHEVWSRWSASYDDVAATAGRLLRTRPRSLADLSMMFSALEWVLLSDAAIVDIAVERQVRRFGRTLRKLAAGP